MQHDFRHCTQEQAVAWIRRWHPGAEQQPIPPPEPLGLAQKDGAYSYQNGALELKPDFESKRPYFCGDVAVGTIRHSGGTPYRPPPAFNRVFAVKKPRQWYSTVTVTPELQEWLAARRGGKIKRSNPH